jgi:hypothetical protein
MIWTEDAEARLRKMMADGLSAGEAARKLGTTAASVLGKRWRLRGGKDKRIGIRKRRKRGQKISPKSNWWTAEQLEAARSLSARGFTYAEIGKKIGRSAKAVNSKMRFRYVGPVVHEVERVRIPEFVLMERDVRLSNSPRSLTAELLGDPLPGYSALDRRATLSQKEAA